MKSIELLEYGGGPADRFAVILDGESYWLPDPREKHFQWVLAVLYMGHVPGTPDCRDWQRGLVFDHWRAAYNLPQNDQARRLAYLVDHYRPAISNDLMVHAGLDLGELWRARRWTLLLDVIDRLPAHSWYASAVSMDENHARMMAEAIEARQKSDQDTEETGPALTTWTPEVAALNNIFDAVNGVQHAIIAVNSPKGKTPEPPKRAPRPTTALEKALKRAQYNRRKTAHDALAARLLPHKKAVKG